MEWIITTLISVAMLIIATLAWLHEKRKNEVDLRIELGAPDGKLYTLRNHGNRTLYTPSLDAEHLAGHRIDRAIFSYQLDPEEPAPFEISLDQELSLPDGVKILYRYRPRGKQHRRYVRLPRPKKIYDFATGEWVDNEET